jgi:hypothetical protein
MGFVGGNNIANPEKVLLQCRCPNLSIYMIRLSTQNRKCTKIVDVSDLEFPIRNNFPKALQGDVILAFESTHFIFNLQI